MSDVIPWAHIRPNEVPGPYRTAITMSRRIRIPQPEGRKGSLKWMQRLAGAPHSGFTHQLQQVFGKPQSWTEEWVSPLGTDDWAEYRDEGFLEKLKLEHLREELSAFWPRGGPQWDALAMVPGGVLLVEAKAHFAELRSACTAGKASGDRIRDALAGTRRLLGSTEGGDWMRPFYQYANRLAHLQFLRDRGVDAYLAFIYFVGDAEMPRHPTSADDWRNALGATYAHLGLESLPKGVASVFIDVRSLQH
jgi:hypothetical protein